MFIPSRAHSWGPSGTRAVAWPQELPADWKQDIRSFNWPAHMQLVRNPSSLWRFASTGSEGWKPGRAPVVSLRHLFLRGANEWSSCSVQLELVETNLGSDGRKKGLAPCKCCRLCKFCWPFAHVVTELSAWPHLCSGGPGQHHLRPGHLT